MANQRIVTIAKDLWEKIQKMGIWQRSIPDKRRFYALVEELRDLTKTLKTTAERDQAQNTLNGMSQEFKGAFEKFEVVSNEQAYTIETEGKLQRQNLRFRIYNTLAIGSCIAGIYIGAFLLAKYCPAFEGFTLPGLRIFGN